MKKKKIKLKKAISAYLIIKVNSLSTFFCKCHLKKKSKDKI